MVPATLPRARARPAKRQPCASPSSEPRTSPSSALAALVARPASRWRASTPSRRRRAAAARSCAPSPVQAFAEAHGIAVRTPGLDARSRRDRGLRGAGAGRRRGRRLRPDPAARGAGRAPAGQRSTCTPRCCRAGAAPRRSSGRSWPATGVTGVQVMRMTEGLDEGPVLASERPAHRRPGDRRDPARPAGRRSARGCWSATLAGDRAGDGVETPQPEEGVTYAKKIRPKEARIDWSKPAAEVDRRIRGLSPFPGAWFMAPGDKGPVRIKALLSRVEDGEGAPGRCWTTRLLIACGTGAVRLLRAQREGRARRTRTTSCAAFACRPAPGSPDAALPADPRVRRRPLQRLPGAGRPAHRAGLDRAGGDGLLRRDRAPARRRPHRHRRPCDSARWSTSI